MSGRVLISSCVLILGCSLPLRGHCVECPTLDRAVELAVETQRSDLLRGHDRFEWVTLQCGTGSALDKGDGFIGTTEYFDDAGTMIGAVRRWDSGPPFKEKFGRIPSCDRGEVQSLRPRALAALERVGLELSVEPVGTRGTPFQIDQSGAPVAIGKPEVEVSCEVVYVPEPEAPITLRVLEIPSGVTAARCDDRLEIVEPLDAGAQLELSNCISVSRDGGLGNAYWVRTWSRWAVRDAGVGQ